MKFIIILLSTILVTGCVSSSYVSSIGAKAMHAKTQKDATTVQIKYSKRLSDVAGYINGDILPYTNLYVPDETLDTANVDFNFEDIEWNKDSSSQGTVDLMIEGESFEFLVNDYYGSDDQIELLYEYRDWYSYPAQSLLLLSMPADVVADVIILPVIGVTALVVALAMEGPMH